MEIKVGLDGDNAIIVGPFFCRIIAGNDNCCLEREDFIKITKALESENPNIEIGKADVRRFEIRGNSVKVGYGGMSVKSLRNCIDNFVNYTGDSINLICDRMYYQFKLFDDHTSCLGQRFANVEDIEIVNNYTALKCTEVRIINAATDIYGKTLYCDDHFRYWTDLEDMSIRGFTPIVPKGMRDSMSRASECVTEKISKLTKRLHVYVFGKGTVIVSSLPVPTDSDTAIYSYFEILVEESVSEADIKDSLVKAEADRDTAYKILLDMDIVVKVAREQEAEYIDTPTINKKVALSDIASIPNSSIKNCSNSHDLIKLISTLCPLS